MKAKSNILKASRLMFIMMAILMLSFCFSHPAEAAKKKGTVSSVKVTNLPAKTLTLAKGKSFKLKVKVEGTGKFNKKVTYKSSKKKVATVSSGGKIKAKKKGTTKITVISKGNKRKKYVITVKVGTPVKTVSLDQSKASLDKGRKLQLHATLSPTKVTNNKLVWSSSDTSVVSVNSSGLVSALKAGRAVVTVLAEDGSGKKASCVVTVTEPKAPPKKTAKPTPTKAPAIELKTLNIVVPDTMKVGETTKVQVHYLPNNAKPVLSFSVDKIDIAEIKADGSLTAKANGTVKITVSAKDAAGKTKTASANVSVFTPVTGVSLDEHNISLFEDEEKQLNVSVMPEKASNKTVVFKSEDEAVASVDVNGLVKAKKAGTTKISVKTEDGSFAAECAVEVKKYPVESVLVTSEDRVLVGSTIEVSATVQPERAEVSITFEGDNPDVAEVSEDGQVTGKSNGIVNVKATAKDSYGNEVTNEKKITVWTAVSEVRLDSSEISVYEETETPLIATVLPEEASFKKVSFTSADESIATVDANGMVTAVSPGTTTITVLSEDGEHSAVCTVEVKKLITAARVDSQQTLEEALQNENLQKLTIASDQNISLVIPNGSFENVVLNVDAPEGHIENHANFQSIVINGISNTTFVECAVGNSIVYKAPDGRLLVDEQAVLNSLTVASGASNLDLVNNGNIANITISTQANVSISGSSERRLDVNATEDAQNAAVHTSITLKITAEAVINIELKPGSENTLVSVDKKDNIPSVTGVGEVPVTRREDGETEVIMAENNGQTTKTVKVSGGVRDTDFNAVKNAVIYFIPFKNGLNEETVSEYLGEAVTTVTTDENGSYVTDPISVGNYAVFAKAEGYSTVFRKVSIASTYEDVYPYSDIIFVNDNAGTNGSIVGILTDTRTNEPLAEGVTVRLRKGADNKSGEYISETTTDSAGMYHFEDLEVGQYTVQVLDLRELEEGSYVTEYRSLTVAAEVVTDGGFSVRFAKAADENQVTFTLTWGDSESGASSDLDSHLVGPTETGGQFHTWYSDQYYYGPNSERYDILDYDDTDYEGPENTTIERNVDGIYSFYVHDYTNRGSTSSDQMGRSFAVVTVHDKEQTLATFNVPNQPGTLWYVCNYDSATGKVVPVNMMSFMEEESEIGVDLALKYRGLLQELLEKAEPIKNKVDAELRGALESAETVYKTSEDGDELKHTYTELRNLLNTRADELRISSISGEDLIRWEDGGYYEDEDDEYYSDSWNEILSGDMNITLKGYSAALTEEHLEVSLYNENSQWVISEDSNDSEKRMITVTSAEGNVCNYHLTYESMEGDCSIDNVSAYIDEIEWINDWYTEKLEDEGDADAYVLYITGYGPEAELINQLVITPRNPHATVDTIQDSDKPAYNKVVTIKAGEASRRYYISWSLSTNCSIRSVDAVVDGEDLIDDWDTEWFGDENDEEYYVLYIDGLGSEEEILANLRIQARNPGAIVGAVEESDRTGYNHSVTIKAGEASRKYYLKFSISNRISIDSVKAVIDGYDRIEDWRTEYIDEVDGIDSYELYLRGYGAEASVLEHLTIISENRAAVIGSLEDTDYRDYHKSVTITAGDYSRKYYINWNQVMTNIGEVSAEDQDGNNLIERSYGSTTMMNNHEIYVLYVEGLSEELPDHLRIVNWFADESAAAEVAVQDSDIEGYDGKIEFTSFGVENTWYIIYTLSDEVCAIDSVYSTDNSVGIDSSGSRSVGFDEDGQEEVIYEYLINGYMDNTEVYDDLTIVPQYEGVVVGGFMESDIPDYEKMVTLSKGNVSRTYYFRYTQLIDTSDFYIRALVDGEDQVTDWYREQLYAEPGEDNYNEENGGYLGEAYVVVLRSAEAKDFVEFVSDKFTAEIADDSDMEGYGMVYFYNSAITENYYLRFVVEEPQQFDEEETENGVEDNYSEPENDENSIEAASGEAADALEQPEADFEEVSEMNEEPDPSWSDGETDVSSEEIPDELSSDYVDAEVGDEINY